MSKAHYVPLMLVLAISACSGESLVGGSNGGQRSAAVTVEITDPGSRVVASRNIVCMGDEPRGSHPDPATACDALDGVDMDVFESVSGGVACTDQFEDDLTGNIRGKVGGKDIDADFALNNGCEISLWHALDGVWFDAVSGEALTQ